VRPTGSVIAHLHYHTGRMRSHPLNVTMPPVILPALPDELLSSWLHRHAGLYGISSRRLLRHVEVDAVSLRSLDLELTAYDQHRLAHAFRSDARVIRQMMQLRGRSRPSGLIATDRPMQTCRRCIGRHQAQPELRGARLRSWMEGWRISCPVCSAPMEDCRALNLLARVDAADPLLVAVAEHAAEGELIVDHAVRCERLGGPIITLMRSLLLPRMRPQQETLVADLPRLLELVVPGFDDFLRLSSPYFRRPGTLLLPMNIRIPVLAGVARVARQPAHWVEGLIAAVGDSARSALASCFLELGASRP
jgi:hypothetical protein